VIHIRAAVLRESGQPLRIEECELDDPGPGEVLIRIRAASLCHSDLSVLDGSRPRVMPMVLGHEAAGEVIQTGDGVDDFLAGDKVVCIFVPNCGRCARCHEGRPALCEPGAQANLAGTLLSGGRRLRMGGAAVNHHLGVSGFAEYAVVSRTSLVKVRANLEFETAALFGCAIITGVGAVLNTANVPVGSSVAIVGAGGVGLSCVLGAVLAGARRIIAVDLNKKKLDFAQELGATDAFDAGADGVAAKIREATGGGVDFAFETAGAAAALALAYQITRRGGTTVTAGLPNPNHQFSIPQISLVAEERTLKGSYMGSCVPQRDIPNYMEMFQRGRLPVERLVTHRIKLDEINEGFDLLASGDAGRILMAV
jgi:Zn-dependent alcohol dehydrogenase